MDWEKLDQRLVRTVPDERQIRYQSLEFYSFIHFTVTTYTGKEWGTGTEKEEIFNPSKFDADQWVSAIKAAGMKALLLTCKHHDGFCLWPSRYTEHTIAGSPFRDGKGDLVKEVSDACRREGIQFGVYLSPWDRNQSTYGMGEAYNDFFVNQLTELLTGYGDVFAVWFDGACGEGENGKKQVYDWDRYYKLIRKLQPNACICVCGSDIRWCGNEAGHTRESEWSVVPKRTGETESIAKQSQQQDDTSFRERPVTAGDEDLGSREILQNESDLIWYPAEVNTSIRPGWFYHEEEDDKVKPLDELLDVYYRSAGGNATFLLNIPPTKEGLIHEHDGKRLQEIGTYLKETFRNNLLDNATLSVDVSEEGFGIESVREDNCSNCFKSPDGIRQVTITVEFDAPAEVSHVVMKENIRMSQRIERFEILTGEGQRLYEGTVVGYKKIAKFDPVTTKELVIRILDARVCPTLAFVGIY